jgi:glucuronoarabinoxylan endo-1,4-beta-xylanase
MKSKLFIIVTFFVLVAIVIAISCSKDANSNLNQDSRLKAAVSCTGIADWSATTIYPTAGAQVVYNCNLYQNNWYTQNQNPATNSGAYQVWTLIGSCTGCSSSSSSSSGGCSATAIVPYIQVNGGSWQQISSVTVASGATVIFGPQPASGGSWSWTGCGTSGTSREQTITASSSCTSTATYTNSCGTKSTQNFTITVSGSSSSGGGSAIINMGITHQLIDGFGASSAWSGAISDGVANGIFTTMGLSICRLRIDPNNGWSDELSNAKKASARGAKVFATPWSPPASMKSNNNVVGGTLKTSSYGAFANWLKSFGDYIKNNGGPTLFCLSVQNEPDWNPDYESCSYTGATMRDFLNSSGSAIGYPIMAPETVGSNTGFADVILNDATAAGKVSFIGFHLYGATPVNYTNALNKGKRVWMTEIYHDNSDINTCMTVAKEVTDCMANNYSGYVWWWINTGQASALCDASGNPNKKGYTLGMFAKYVRPGCVRVDATYNPSSNVYITAYNDSNGKLRIVAVNTGTSSVSQAFSVSGSSLGSMTVYCTSGSQNNTNLGTVSGTSFTYTLTGQSVTTFVQ